MKIRIPNALVQDLLGGKKVAYPKYSTQIMVLANQNAQGTRPNVVGQMSDLIQEFDGSSMAEWEKWYLEKHPEAIEKATEKIFNQLESLKKTIQDIDKDLVRNWVEDFLITKTFSGLKFQEAILKIISQHLKKEYRLATPNEESKGIDGIIGGKPISIKPITYKMKNELLEDINVPIVYYNKKKTDITIEFDEQDFE
jgi:hypothetical protein